MAIRDHMEKYPERWHRVYVEKGLGDGEFWSCDSIVDLAIRIHSGFFSPSRVDLLQGGMAKVEYKGDEAVDFIYQSLRPVSAFNRKMADIAMREDESQWLAAITADLSNP